jgi:hypothetical protein
MYRLAEAVQSADRAALARAITLIESILDQDRHDAELLLEQFPPPAIQFVSALLEFQGRASPHSSSGSEFKH